MKREERFPESQRTVSFRKEGGSDPQKKIM